MACYRIKTPVVEVGCSGFNLVLKTDFRPGQAKEDIIVVDYQRISGIITAKSLSEVSFAADL